MKRPQDGERYGPLTLDRYRAFVKDLHFLHVFVNGEDVTTRCIFADDSVGQQYAVLFKLNADGQKYVGADGCAARELVAGEVVIKPGAPLADGIAELDQQAAIRGLLR